MKTKHLSEHISLIEGFWSPEKCRDFIFKSEKAGYDDATVDTEKGARVIESVRNNQRVIYEEHQLAADIWSQLKPLAPARIGRSQAVGLNEMFRFYKYQPGQQFKKHIDQSFIRDDREASYYTFMIYLNEDFKGGETAFHDIVIKPCQGMALIFLHSLEHEGSEVLEGVKYVLRTDIMYRLDPD